MDTGSLSHLAHGQPNRRRCPETPTVFDSLTSRLATDYCMVPWFRAGVMILLKLTQHSNVRVHALSATRRDKEDIVIER